jgi:non-ribosomal peptide synthetase component F
MLAGSEGERLWSYWQKQLAGELPVLNLATDRPRPSVQTFRGASESFKLSAELTKELKALSQNNGATLYMTLLAAFQTLLHRYTGQTDILVGSPTAGRNWVDLSNLVGYFANPIVLRADLAGDPTFESFLCSTRQVALDAFKHQDHPFALLVERLQPVRDPGRSPLFQAMFVLQKAHLRKEEALVSFALNESGAQMDLDGLLMESVVLEREVAQFDMTLVMAETAGTLSASFQYNTDLFDAATISRMA